MKRRFKRCRSMLVSLWVLFVLMSLLTGCSDTKAYSTLSILERENFVRQIPEYDSPYTVCYENQDGTYSMYIFSAPIQYKTDADQYEVIDNAVISSQKNEFAFENKANSIKTYFPKSLDDFFRVEENMNYIEFLPEDTEGFSQAKHRAYTNMYGTNVDAVCYEREDMDYVFYPVRSGIKMEVILKEKPKNFTFSYAVETYAKMLDNQQNGYVLFRNGSENAALVYQPLVQYKTKGGEEQLDISSIMKTDGGSGYSIIQIQLNPDILGNDEVQYPVKFDPSFELYLNKMPDTSVYSKFNTNSYLRHYAVVGEHPELGEGWEYARLRLNYFMTAASSSIIQSTTNFRLLNQTGPLESELYVMTDDWSSTKMVWDNRVFPKGSWGLKSSIKGSLLSFDISELVKECFESGNKKQESFGYVLRHSESNDYLILASSENAVYSPFVEIRMSRLPVYFEAVDNINRRP